MLPFFQTMAQQLMTSNPLFQRAVKMAEGKSPEELKQIAQNLCQNRGINMDEAFDAFKVQMMGSGNGMHR